MVQWLVARAWPIAYNPRINFISDLGNTACGWSGSRYICSPEHHWMNASFILLGLTVSMGALLMRRQHLQNRLGLVSTILFVASGVGTITIGLVPENLSLPTHIIGAYVDGYAGVLAILFFALSMHHQQRFQWLSKISFWLSITLIILCILYTANYYLNLGALFDLEIGPGGMEKLTNYPIYIWQILAGFVLFNSKPPRVNHNQTHNNR